MITVPQGGSIAGRSADIRIERPDIGGFVAEAASAVAEKMGKIVATQRAVKYSQTELAMTKELGTEYQRVAQYTDPAQIEAEWPQIEAGIRDKYVNAKDENGKPLLTPDEADTLGLQLGGLSVKHGFNLGARAIELTDSQAKAAWDTARLDIVNTAATADPDTMGALIELGEAAIDRLPGILPDEAVKQKQEFRAGVANARVIAAIDQDPLAAVAALKAGTYDDLGAEAVAQRIVTAQAEADRRAAAAATAGEAEAKKRTDAIGKDLDTMTTLFGKGVKVAQEDLLNDPAYKAHPKYPEAVAARDLAREVPNIRQMTPTQLDAEIAKEKAKPKDAAYQTERLTVLQTWRDEAVTALDTDPKAALTTAGLPAPAIPAFDPADTAPFTAALAESISFDEFQRGKGYTDKSAIFSKGDKTALQAVLAPGADAGPKVALLTAIETGSNGKAGEVLAALEADPVTRRTAKVLRVTRDPGLAEAILRGGQKLDGKTVVPPSRKDQVMAFDALTGGVFDDQPALKAELMEATLALYADNARGIDGETQSTAGDGLAAGAAYTVYHQSLQQLLGAQTDRNGALTVGGLQEVNGGLTVLPVGMSVRDVEAGWDRIAAGLSGRTGQRTDRDTTTGDKAAVSAVTMDVFRGASTDPGALPDLGSDPAGRFATLTLSRVGESDVYELMIERNGRMTPVQVAGQDYAYRFRLKDLMRGARP